MNLHFAKKITKKTISSATSPPTNKILRFRLRKKKRSPTADSATALFADIWYRSFSSCILLRQLWGPRAVCSTDEGFVRPSKFFINGYVQYNDNMSLFW